MRLLITADLHYNHPRSRALADELIDEINRTDGDALLVIGDTGVADGDSIEQALSRFTIRGPRLFVAGNHELWTRDGDSHAIFSSDLPRRVRNLGWHWLEEDPWLAGDVVIVGSIGWYDYSFAVPELQIHPRFYAAKVSPGVAGRLSAFSHLIEGDESKHASDIIARWNDGKFVRLGQSDQAFLDARVDAIQRQLRSLPRSTRVLAAVHHVPFAELLPPRRGMQWDFARAYLGSSRMGEALLASELVKWVYCGHSHWPAEARVGEVHAVNIGSGYRSKTFRVLDL